MLSSAALDEALRSEAAYGLDGYALSSASYTLVEAREEGEEDQVLCALYYVASGEDYRSRTFTVDARTGAVQSIWSSAPWLEEGESPALTGEQAQARAEDYLSRLCGGRWDTLALAEEESLERAAGPTTPSPTSASPTASPSRRTTTPWPSTPWTDLCTAWTTSTART